MAAFGERLRREREMRGVSLDEISAATKIGTRLLRALEEEQFELLPGGIFNKGFVRSYARYLGIDEEAAVADYLEAHGRSDPDLRVIAAQNTSEYAARNERSSGGSPRGSFPLLPVLILIVLVAGASGGWRMYQEHKADVAARTSSPPTKPRDLARDNQTARAEVPAAAIKSQTIPAESNDSRPVSAPAPANHDPVTQRSAAASTTAGNAPDTKANTTAIVAPQESAPASGGTLIAGAKPDEGPLAQFEVIVKAKDRAWVSIKSDGKVKVRGIIKPPDIKTIYANDEVVFWTGNAGDVQVSFNGKDVPLSGGQNEERVLVFNSRGLLPPQAQSQ